MVRKEIKNISLNKKIEYMNKALLLASKGLGKTHPNPVVGAIIVKNNKIIGQGYHRKYGDLHAEVMALRNCKESPEGASIFVNLEPCNHYGKQPPCTHEIIKNKISRVYIGATEINKMAKGGRHYLKKKGIYVETKILEKECREINAPFFKYYKTGLPYVVLKWAMTLDGNIATSTGESKWISSKKARTYVHKLRNIVDAVLVGINTVKKDNPLLTCRIQGGRNPIKLIIDTKLEISLNASLFKEGKVVIFHGKTVSTQKYKLIQKKYKNNVELIEIKEKRNSLDIKEILQECAKKGILSILVEGGSKIFRSFMDYCDEICCFISPILFKGHGTSVCAGKTIEKVHKALKLKKTSYRYFDNTFFINGYLTSYQWSWKQYIK